MSMSRKDYKVVAEAIRSQREHEGNRGNAVLDELVIRLMSRFRTDNPNFDQEKFRTESDLEKN